MYPHSFFSLSLSLSLFSLSLSLTLSFSLSPSLPLLPVPYFIIPLLFSVACSASACPPPSRQQCCPPQHETGQTSLVLLRQGVARPWLLGCPSCSSCCRWVCLWFVGNEQAGSGRPFVFWLPIYTMQQLLQVGGCVCGLWEMSKPAVVGPLLFGCPYIQCSSCCRWVGVFVVCGK